MQSTTGLVLARRIAAGSAMYAVACIAGIYLSESGRIPISESWFHGTQFLACTVGAAASTFYFWLGRKRAEPRARRAAMAAILLGSVIYLGLVAFVMASLMVGPAY